VTEFGIAATLAKLFEARQRQRLVNGDVIAASFRGVCGSTFSRPLVARMRDAADRGDPGAVAFCAQFEE
jgi:hypothetical protein